MIDTGKTPRRDARRTQGFGIALTIAAVLGAGLATDPAAAQNPPAVRSRSMPASSQPPSCRAAAAAWPL